MLLIPSFTLAQQQTCEQRAAVLSQLIEDMSRTRGTVSATEIEAASLKVIMKSLQGELEQAKKAVGKKPDTTPGGESVEK